MYNLDTVKSAACGDDVLTKRQVIKKGDKMSRFVACFNRLVLRHVNFSSSRTSHSLQVVR